MNFKQAFIIVSVFLFFSSCKEGGTTPFESFEQSQGSTFSLPNDFDYYPTSTSKSIYEHKGYALSYVEEYEQAEWVAYFLTDADFSSQHYERPYFIQDPLVKTKSADWRNFKNSGYNKGHLCPAGDRKRNFTLYEETFLTSNVSPQLYEFNAGIWNRLEQKVRYWASTHDGVYVVTGGVLSEGLQTIGKENVAIPNYFYKVLLTHDGSKMIGFLVPHKNSNKTLYEFIVPVDTIEKMTGIDFFPALEDSIENRLEAKSDKKGWNF